MALTNKLTPAINSIPLLLSVLIIGSGIWLAIQQDNSCLNLLQWPVIILGILFLLVSLAGFVGALWRNPRLLIFYFVGMPIMVIMLLCLVIFIYAVTVRGSGHLEPNRAYMEYELDDYSGWLRRRVESPWKWDRIKGCLSSSNMCPELNRSYPMAQDFFNAPLSPLQSGCCKPPTQCGFTFVSPSYWISPINNGADMDCLKWDNDQRQLCYGCDSCKAGLLANIKREWRTADIIFLVTLIALIVVYLSGCAAYRKAKTDKLFSDYHHGYT